MSRRSKLVVAAVALLAAAALAFFIWRGRTGGVAEVYPVSNLNVFGDDYATMSGTIEAGKVQEVRLANGIVNEMRVKEGDKVNEGDVLMVYDTESYQITLLTDEAKIAVLEASLNSAKREISRLSGLRPSEQGGGGGGGTRTIDHGALKLLGSVTSDSQGVDGEEYGSECERVFLCTSDAVVSADYLKSLRGTNRSVEFRLYREEMVEGVSTQVCFGSWIVNGKDLPKTVTSYEPVDPVIANVKVSAQLDDGVEWPEGVTISAQLLAGEAAQGDPQDLGAAAGQRDATFKNLPVKGQDGKDAAYAVDVKPVREGVGEPADPSGDDGTSGDDEEKLVLSEDLDTLYVDVETLEVRKTREREGSEGDDEGSETHVIELTYAKEYPDTLYKKVTGEAIADDWQLSSNIELKDDGASLVGPVEYGYGKFYPRNEAYERFEIVDSEGNVAEGDDFAYSRAEITQMIADKQREMRTTDIELRKARLAYQRDQITAQTGEVKADISGTVTKVVPYDDAKVDSVIIEVRGDKAYTLVTYIDELSRDGIHVGDELDVYSYESGSSSTARVTEVLDAPSADGAGMGFGDVNPNSSWYPVKAEILDKEAPFVVGEYCDVRRLGQEESGGDIYLPTMFVRKDAQGHYVLVAGEDGRLERRQVTTGKTLWGMYLQISSGLTVDDSVAFPYGKLAVEGMQTEQVDYPEY